MEASAPATTTATATSPEEPAVELHAVRFLRREGLEALVAKFGLQSSRHTLHPNLVLFKYDQVQPTPPPFLFYSFELILI
jgi:hypothetical protein